MIANKDSLIADYVMKFLPTLIPFLMGVFGLDQYKIGKQYSLQEQNNANYAS